MPLAADIITNLAASRPTNDEDASGGVIAPTFRPLDEQFDDAAKVAVASDGADVRTVTVVFVKPLGGRVTEVLQLAGAVEVLSAADARWLESVTASVDSADRTITVRQGSGGDLRHTIAPDELGGALMFQRATSDPLAAVLRFEKQFVRNAHATETGMDGELELTADAANIFRMGIAAAKNDALDTADRLTPPAGITFVDDNVIQGVPGADLGPGEAIGYWVELNLAAAALAGSASFQVTMHISNAA